MSELKHELGIIALESCKELGNAIDKFIQEKRNTNESFLIPINEIRFSNGEGKVKISESVRGKDIYILCDIGNYSCTYKMFGFVNHKGPDEHFQDIKRTVSAIRGKAAKITVIMPLLYESRQHSRNGRESLDCALALQELTNMGVESIITFDAHDPRVQNAIPLKSFETVQPTYQFIKYLVKNVPDVDFSNMMVISPDEGGMSRAVYFANVLGVDLGMFYKRRDYTTLVNGRNPIVAHEFLGADIEGKDMFIIDDMISSGESMIDCAKELKRRKAGRIFVASTFGLFTNGFDKFDEAYEQGLIYRVLTTNLVYQPEELLAKPYYINVDMSKYIALLIDTLNHDSSISKLLNPTERIQNLLNEHNNKNK